MSTPIERAAEIVSQARAAASKVDGWRPELASVLCDAEREIRGLAPSNKVVDTQELADRAGQLGTWFAEYADHHRAKAEAIEALPGSEAWAKVERNLERARYAYTLQDDLASRTTQCSGDTQGLAAIREIVHRLKGDPDVLAEEIWEHFTALRTTHSPSEAEVEASRAKRCDCGHKDCDWGCLHEASLRARAEMILMSDLGPLTDEFDRLERDDQRDVVERLAAYLSLPGDKLRDWARKVSIAFTAVSGGGSEMFTQIDGDYYADPDACRTRVEEKLRQARALRSSDKTVELLREARPYVRLASVGGCSEPSDGAHDLCKAIDSHLGEMK